MLAAGKCLLKNRLQLPGTPYRGGIYPIATAAAAKSIWEKPTPAGVNRQLSVCILPGPRTRLKQQQLQRAVYTGRQWPIHLAAHPFPISADCNYRPVRDSSLVPNAAGRPNPLPATPERITSWYAARKWEVKQCYVTGINSYNSVFRNYPFQSQHQLQGVQETSPPGNRASMSCPAPFRHPDFINPLVINVVQDPR